MTDNDKEYIKISEESELADLIHRIEEKELFAKKFKFTDRELFVLLLESIGIEYDDFEKNYYYYDRNRNIHIAESQFEYVWISTFGVVAKDKSTDNKAVNSCINQYTVISLLMEKAIEVSKSDTIYDVDAYNFGYISELSPAIFHNILFYIEVFCKAYLSLNSINPLHTHKLSLVYQKAIETMRTKGHNDSLFQIRILDPLYKFVDHVNSIPGNFKEQFVKYDDNHEDDTVIIFQPDRLIEVMTIFELSHDFIVD